MHYGIYRLYEDNAWDRSVAYPTGNILRQPTKELYVKLICDRIAACREPEELVDSLSVLNGKKVLP
jgi:hypothetical protein